MHHYATRYDEIAPDELTIESFRFTSADDMAEWASFNCSVGHVANLQAWHLDDHGEMQCWTGGGCHGLPEWAEDPYVLLRSRREGIRNGGCVDRWVIIDSRPAWLQPPPTVTEADPAAFVRLRATLARVGVSLLDAVVFDDQQHWWSMHELTSGSTMWPTAA